MNTLAFYVTGHGYGHAARSADVLSALLASEPEWQFRVISDLPAEVMEKKFPSGEGIHLHHRFVDGGLVQRDALHTDVPASATVLARTLGRWDEVRNHETTWMMDQQIDLVLADVPGIPLEAAACAGLPSIALANFGWDFIYQEFEAEGPVWEKAANRYRYAYETCGLLLQYPWSPEMEAFPTRREIGLVAPKGESRRTALCRQLGVPTSTRLVLLGLTSFDPIPDGFSSLQDLEDTLVFTTPPLDFQSQGLPCVPWDHDFRDLVASVDLVITKPGFGIFSECARNEVPMLLLERMGFSETPYLLAGLGKNLRGIPIRRTDLNAKGLPALLDQAAALPASPHPLAADGAEQIRLAIREQLEPRS